ncbi:MAG: NAD(P)H-dependent oxidoreductase subunit E [Synechococcaceae cyanobacterium]|nr:NAD(P)H-dependent oxidoreductase subunit E [Synechococcaceae cyanobacterium]
MSALQTDPASAAGSSAASETASMRAIARIVRRHGGRADALIEVLHQVQNLHGHLPKPALDQVARLMRLPGSRVYGVASFYHLFRLEAPTPHRCAVCLGTACYVKGAARLAARLEARLGVRLDDPHGDGTWTLQRVSCLGACGQAPVLVIDGHLHTRLPLDAAEPRDATGTLNTVAAHDALDARLDRAGLPAAPAR